MNSKLLAALPLLVATAGAHALTLDFGNGPDAPTICSSTGDGLGALVTCANYAYLSQGYGDIAGLVDVNFSAPRVPGVSLHWWDTSYNTLYGVAWADGGDGDSQARIEILALQPGDSVLLSGFDLGAYASTTRNTTVNIYAVGGGTPLYTYTGAVGDGAVAATSFVVNVSAPGGLWIEWQDSAYNVGIDNIQYSVSSVPEPAAAGLMLAGLLGMAAAAASRRRG